MALNKKGLTLIENLIAVFVVSATLVGLTKIYYLSNYQTNVSRHRVMAINLAQAQLENIINTGYNNIVVGVYPTTQNVVIDPGLEDGSSDDISGVMVTSFSNLNVTEGYKFIVTITWSESVGSQNRPMTEIVETLLTSYE